MISVILVEPQEAGNVGAIARAMANFGLNDLILVNPKCDHLCEDSRRRAVRAGSILEKAKVVKTLKETKADYLAATTSLMGTDYNIPRSPIKPEDFVKKIPLKRDVGLVFGRESSGLSNQEIEICDFVVTIPSSKKYPAMNISHAASVIFYELSKKKENITDHVIMASGKDKEIIYDDMNKVLETIRFSTKEKRQTQKTVWKRVFSKAMLTKREAFAVIGFLKKLQKK